MATGNLIACICEGTAERVIIDKLLDENMLLFSREDLLDEEVLKCRNAKVFQDRYLGKGFSKKITVYRILDSRRENFKLSNAYKHKVDVINVITAPEIEMLVIINEGKYKDYQKVKSTVKPSDYCIKTLKMPDVKNYEFIKEYFRNIDNLIDSIKEYKKLAKDHKGELCLADILK